jgi:hypothetical protein
VAQTANPLFVLRQGNPHETHCSTVSSLAMVSRNLSVMRTDRLALQRSQTADQDAPKRMARGVRPGPHAGSCVGQLSGGPISPSDLAAPRGYLGALMGQSQELSYTFDLACGVTLVMSLSCVASEQLVWRLM